MKSYTDWSLTTKQNVALITLLIVIFGGIFLVVRQQMRARVSEDLKSNALAAIQLSAERINSRFPPVMSAARELAAALEELQPDAEKTGRLLKETLRRVRELNPSLCGISIAYELYTIDPKQKYFMLYAKSEADGSISLSRLGGKEYPYEKYDWFVLPKYLNHAVWTEPYYDSAVKVEMTTFSQPIRNKAGQFTGITGFDVSLQGLNDLTAGADAFGYGKECLLSRFGRFLACPDAARIPAMRGAGNPVLSSTIFSIADRFTVGILAGSGTAESLERIGREMLAGKTGSVPLSIFDGKKVEHSQFYFAPIPATGWSLGVSYPEDELFAGVNRVQWMILGLGALGILLMFLAITFINRRLTTPLKQLTNAVGCLGCGNFTAALNLPQGGDEIGRLSQAFVTMRERLADYVEKLRVSTIQQERIESELSVAREIQQGILPHMLPPLPDTPDFSLFATLRPARMVGGDLYDFFFVDESHYAFMIGDVSGKGVPAALFMAITQTLQRTVLEERASTGKLVTKLNSLLGRNNDSLMFVTYFLGILDVTSGEVEYTVAGHNPPYLVRKDGTLELLNTRHGPALGVTDRVYSESRFKLGAGETIVLYTDGVTEAENEQERSFGADSLQRVLMQHRSAPPHIVGDDILAAVERFAGDSEQADDITLLLLRFNGAKTE